MRLRYNFTSQCDRMECCISDLSVLCFFVVNYVAKIPIHVGHWTECLNRSMDSLFG